MKSDTMSVRELKQVEPVHSNRRMSITSYTCDMLMMGERKQEGSKVMEQKVYKVMRGAGATNIALGVITIVAGIVSGILLIITGAKLLAGKSKILL